MVELPMEIWARIASFLPFSELVPTFQILYDANILPDTGTTASNALLQFSSEHGYVSDDDEVVVPNSFVFSLLQMGFGEDLIEYAVIVCNSNQERIIDFLLNHYTPD